MDRVTQGRFHSQEVRSGDAGGAGLLDAEHLQRQAGDDAALAAEVLALFAEQARESRAALDRMSAEALPHAMHRLKGSARAVGAFLMAERAAALESRPGDDRLRQMLAAVIDQTLDAIADRAGG